VRSKESLPYVREPRPIPSRHPGRAVPLLDLKPLYRPLAAEIQAAIEKVCSGQAFILGPPVKELEAAVG
jgi:hypothetical protein